MGHFKSSLYSYYILRTKLLIGESQDRCLILQPRRLTLRSSNTRSVHVAYVKNSALDARFYLVFMYTANTAFKVTTTKCSCPICYPTPLSEDDGVGKCQKVRSTTGNCPSTSDGGFCETCNSENRVEAFCQDCGVYICIQCFKSHFNNIAH